jgi:hypothetical protein
MMNAEWKAVLLNAFDLHSAFRIPHSALDER